MEIVDFTKEEAVITTTDKLGKSASICSAFGHNLDRICGLIAEKKIVLRREAECMEQERHLMKIQLDKTTKNKSKQNAKTLRLKTLKNLLTKLDGSSSDEMFVIFEEK